jgi:hypothetical protein
MVTRRDDLGRPGTWAWASCLTFQGASQADETRVGGHRSMPILAIHACFGSKRSKKIVTRIARIKITDCTERNN